MFEFKLKKMSHRAFTCGLGSASGGTRSIRKLSLTCLTKRHESCKDAQQTVFTEM